VSNDPLITIILPIRNEARYIARCLDAVGTQSYPSEKIEIIIVDGMSDDGTREIVTEFIISNGRARLLDNPERIVPTALNRGIRAAQGDIIIRVDGHAIIEHDYVQRCIADLNTVQADCVGGPIRTVGETWLAKGIALAQSSPFGVGNAAFRYTDRAQYVDTLAFGAYRREVFDRIGLFDEELVRNQDDEFNLRLLLAGGKIWLDPQIRSLYYSRSTLLSLWNQYLGYGLWKVRVIQKHGRPASWRHLVPAAFLAALVLSTISGIILSVPIWLAVVFPYLLASFIASLQVSSRYGWRYLVLLPLVFAILHVAYGAGFLAGLARFARSRRATPKSQSQ
jgi:succinoglycan biosynthesis protein ExoA